MKRGPDLLTATRLLALVLPSLLLLGGAELGLRIAQFGESYQGDDLLIVRSDDPVLIYELRPSHRKEAHGVEYRTNAAGFRDREFGPKAADRFRIIVVGDSVVFGYRQPAATLFPQRLQQRLTGRRSPRVEVFNMGTPGYNSIQEVRLIETRALAYEPDLLVLPYVHNDNKVDGADGGLSRYFHRSPSRLFDWLSLRVRRLASRIGRDVVTQAYDDLAAIASRTKLPVVVVILPVLRFSGGAEAQRDRHRAVRELAEERGFRVLDLFDAFVEADFETLMLDRIHPNARGNELVARHLHAFLDDTGLLPEGR